MAEIRSRSALPIGRAILLVVGVITVLVGLLPLVGSTSQQMSPIEEEWTGVTWSFIQSRYPAFSDWVGLNLALMQTFIIALGVLSCVVAWVSFRRGARWAWYALAYINFVVYIPIIVVAAIVGHEFLWPAVVIFIIALVGLAFPAREVLRKAP